MSLMISAYRLCASSDICVRLKPFVSKTPVGWEYNTNGTASNPLIHSIYEIVSYLNINEILTTIYEIGDAIHLVNSWVGT